MSKLDNSNEIQQTQKILKDKKMIGFTFFSTLFKLIGKYVRANEQSFDQSFAQKQEYQTKERRLQGIQQINKFVQKAISDNQLLQEQKNDCLIQSLHLINKMHSLLKNDIETRSKQLSFRKQQQQIQALQRSVIQKLAEVILINFFPKKMTIKTVKAFICIVIQQIYQYSPNTQQAQNQKRKTKKPQKKKKIQKVNIECRMQDGSKINIIWYLMFRAVQKSMENLDQIWHKQLSQCKNNKPPSYSDMIDKHIFKYIHQIINHIILVQFKELNLLQQFVRTIVQNINQYELPIVPFFLKGFHSLFQQKFKLYYTLGLEKEISQRITSKQIFCLQNIAILLQLIKTSAKQIILLQTHKLPYSASGVCSYCGIIRTNSMERLFYQKISINLNQAQNLVVKICEECCQNLNTTPKEQKNLITLAPLILSRFWKKQFGNRHYQYLKQSLRTTMKYHCLGQPKIKPNSEQNIFITDTVAMNNVEQKQSHSILQQIYSTFIFLHSQLSIKQILLNIIQILIICWNSKDQKMRDKSIKILGRSSFISLFQQIKLKIPQQFKEFEQIRQKIVKGLYIRLRDTSSTVSLCSLDILTDFFLQNIISNQQKTGFFDIVLQLIKQKQQPEFRLKSLDLVEKLIAKTRSLTKKQQQVSLLNYLHCLFKTINLCTYFLSKNLNTSNRTIDNIREHFSKFLCKLLNKTVQFCDQKYCLQTEQLLLSLCQQFLYQQNIKQMKLTSLNEIEIHLIIKIYSQIKIDAFLFKNMPTITPSYFSMLFGTADNNNNTIQLIIKNNILFIIDLVYQEVIQVKQHMFGIIKRSSTSKLQRVSNHTILQYLHSPVFLSILLYSPQDKQQEIPKSYKLEILNKLLYLNNINEIIINSREMTNYMTLWLKTKQKSANYIISKIITNQILEQKLEKLSNNLLQNIKQTDINRLEQDINLIVNIKIYLGSIQQLKGIIQIYEKYCQRFNNSFLMQNTLIKTYKDPQTVNEFLSKYITLTRCIHISTAFVTSFQNYLLLNQKMQEFCQQKIDTMLNSKSRRSSGSTKPFKQFLNRKNKQNQMITTSASFKNMYLLILNLLDASSGNLQKEPYFYQLTKKNLFLLHQYWRVHSKIAFLEPKLLNIFKTINQNHHQNLIIIKQMYKLFQSLLPSTNLELLNFIRDQFTKKFHIIIKTANIQIDSEILQISFNIIYHLLKSGMDGLYYYNKYIYLGLFHESEKVNQIVIKIIHQMYSQEVSEKILFINIGECIQLISDIYFKNKTDQLFEQPNFTFIQRNNIKILSEIGKKQGNNFLPKEKKEIKLKTTFVKKIGDYLGNEINLLKTKPKIFLLIMKLLKCQQTLDYSELSEIIFCLSKTTKINQIFAQKIIQSLKSTTKNNIRSDSQTLHNQILIILAYRQLTSCLAYFSKYSDSAAQVKNYSHLFQTCINPYVNLEQVIPLTTLEPQQSLITKIQKVQNDINLFIDIVIGGVQYLPSKNVEYDQQIEDPEISNQTQKTKPKIQSKIIVNRGKIKKNKTYYLSKSTKHLDRTLQQQSSDQFADTYKQRLRQQKPNIYFSDQD